MPEPSKERKQKSCWMGSEFVVHGYDRVSVVKCLPNTAKVELLHDLADMMEEYRQNLQREKQTLQQNEDRIATLIKEKDTLEKLSMQYNVESEEYYDAVEEITNKGYELDTLREENKYLRPSIEDTVQEVDAIKMKIRQVSEGE